MTRNRCGTLCHAGDFGGGEHQLSGPVAGAQEPGGDPGEIQSLCAESEPVGWAGLTRGESTGERSPVESYYVIISDSYSERW